MIGLGPLSMAVVVALIAGAISVAAARAWARRVPDAPAKAAGSLVVDALWVGLLAARAGYVLRWWPQYAAAPWSILALGDGGFAWWAGLPAALAFVLWRTRRATPLRRPALAGMVAGLAAWALAHGALDRLRASAPMLPQTPLVALDGSAARLADHAGHPVVVNLWATWCPPCRREMPAFAEAQDAYPGVRFVLPNQGEDAVAIQSFLRAQGLSLDHVLRDPHSDTMRAFGSRGLPTTLFFDRNGRLVDTHMGELTRARLADVLHKRFGVAAPDSSHPPGN